MINVIKLILRDRSLAEDIELILPLEDNLIREDVDTIEELEIKWKKGIGNQNNFKFEEMEIIQVFENEAEKTNFIANLPNLFFGDNLVRQTRIANEIIVILAPDETVICEYLGFYIFSSLADRTIVKYNPYTQEEHVIITANPDITNYYLGSGNDPRNDYYFECSKCNYMIVSEDGYFLHYREKVYDNTPKWEKSENDEDDTDWEELQYTCIKCKEKEDAASGMNESIINGYMRGYFNFSSKFGYELHKSFYIKGEYPKSESHARFIEEAKKLNNRFLLMVEWVRISNCTYEGEVNLLKKRRLIEKEPDPEDYGFYSQSGFDDLASGWMIEGGEEAYYEDLKYYKQQQLEKGNGI